MNYAAQFDQALAYTAFLDKYATSDQPGRWETFRNAISLTADQTTLLQSFTREMHVLVIAGAWCGDCVNQCPIFEHITTANPLIQVRYADRDDNPELAAELQICGGARVPSVVFLSEDNQFCGHYGDRTLSRYRATMAKLTGAACPTGLLPTDDHTPHVIQDWLNEFERVQWMLRTSTRLRQVHGD